VLEERRFVPRLDEVDGFGFWSRLDVGVRLAGRGGLRLNGLLEAEGKRERHAGQGCSESDAEHVRVLLGFASGRRC
jgi:hypothetical protein